MIIFSFEKRKEMHQNCHKSFILWYPTPPTIHRSFIKFHYASVGNVNSHWNWFYARFWKSIPWKMHPVYIEWTPKSLAMWRLIWNHDTVKFRNRIKNSPRVLISRLFTDMYHSPVRFHPSWISFHIWGSLIFLGY